MPLHRFTWVKSTLSASPFPRISLKGSAGTKKLSSWVNRERHANLGWFYQSGYGVTKNPQKAFELLSYAAEHGVLSAKAAIGIMLLKGETTEPDSVTGLKKLEEAFNEGYLNAGNHLSDIYFEGKYVEKDIEQAHRWLWNVANCGDERSMAILGHYLITGSHGKKDTDTGLKLMHKAIEKRFLPAYLWLGTLYKKETWCRTEPQKSA